MPDYFNPHNHDVHLVGPDGRKVHIRKVSTIRLSAYFDRYIKQGFLRHRDAKTVELNKDVAIKTARAQLQRTLQAQPKSASAACRVGHKPHPHQAVIRKIVGSSHMAGATELLHHVLATNFFPVSNHIGVGILSFNRLNSLRRLVNSIIRFTELRSTTVFISDDGSTDTELLDYLRKLDRTNNFVVLINSERLGIAGNSNRLLRCLSRFAYKILLNDDAEILSGGWDKFYPDAMRATGFHHFCCNQPGVYGAKSGSNIIIHKRNLVRVDDKPHGAVMVFDQAAFDKIGYFDETFGLYGCEHVDWSSRVVAAGLQPAGFFDVDGSLKYFQIHSEPSAVPDRVRHLHAARDIYQRLAGRDSYIEASNKTAVPRMSCVVPFRDAGRHWSILTAIDSVRAQRFPDIELVLAEQDDESRFKLSEFGPSKYVLAPTHARPFNKSMAFNAGVAQCTAPIVLLHDADTVAPANYAKMVHAALQSAEACHLGSRVLYANRESTDHINTTKIIDDAIKCEKIVTYFEGGSLACHLDVYWRVGGFVEAFWGYGVEDCDFYYRLSRASTWYENRVVDFLHLWHSRTGGWVQHHDINKKVGKQYDLMSLSDRIAKQRRALSGTYARFIK